MIPLYEPNIMSKDINEVTKSLKAKNLSGASKQYLILRTTLVKNIILNIV